MCAHIPHSEGWYRELAARQRGYYHPWRSKLGPGDGERAYTEVVLRHLSPALDVMDVGCGHGLDALEFAARARSLLGYDMVPDFIRLANEAAVERGSKNVRFEVWNSNAREHGGRARLPAPDRSVDLFVSRRGPTHWIEDARRVGRDGAVLIQLNPVMAEPPEWNRLLPETLCLPSPRDDPRAARHAAILDRIRERLRRAEIPLHSYWVHAVPEYLSDPEQLWIYLTWGRPSREVPAFAEVRPALEQIFDRNASIEGLAVPHVRLLWKARL